MRLALRDALTPLLAMRLSLRALARGARELRVLNFHAILPGTLDGFRRIVESLQNDRRVLAPADFFEALDGPTPLREQRVLITFDDGLKSQFAAARTVLDPLGIKALFFIPTGFMDREPPEAAEYVASRIYAGFPRTAIPAGYEPMTWTEVEALVKAGHVVGSHTRSHPRLSQLSASEVEEEVVGAKRDLRSRVGASADAFAYPFGDVGSISRTALEVIGRHHRYSFSGLRGGTSRATLPLAIPRDEVTSSTPVNRVRLIVRGLYDPIYAARRARLNGMAAPPRAARE